MMVPTTFLVNTILLSALLYRAFITRSGDRWLWFAFLLFVTWLVLRGYRLKRRVADLLIHAAQTVGLKRVSGEKARPRAAL
jgi:uncharacterized SAM-binding protein YcdF (DUF218 family)